MNDIPNEITDFYNSLENLQSLNIWNIQKELKNSERIENWDDKVIIERKVLSFNLNNGQLLSNSQITDLNGKIINNIHFSEIEIIYLKNRLNTTLNFWLKSRYSHILWQITKHKEFAEKAIDNYIETIKTIKANEVRELSILVSAIFYISRKSKIKIDESKELASELINELPYWLKGIIVNEILTQNYFTKNELVNISEKIINWIELDNPNSHFTNKNNLEIAVKLFDKIQKPKEPIYKLLAKNEDLILNQHPNDEDFVKITTIGNKASYLKKAKDKKNLEIVLKEYNRLKQKVKLKKISIPLDDKGTKLFNDYLKIKSESILKLPNESILAYFSVNEDILVDPIHNTKIAEDSIKKSVYHLFSTTTFDINSNHKNLNDKEKLEKQKIDNYIISHNIHCYSLFLKVFVNGVICGKINYYKIYEYLEEHTWFGEKFKRSISTDLDDDSTWLSMLAPGIHNLFSQFELSILMNTNKINNFILAIDSLTLKFEGALRDFIRLSGGNTTKDNQGELKEQLLDELLDNPKIKEYFSVKDIELFKNTFTNKGRNIRNNVAHSFMVFSDYNLQIALLIFFCILRLSKYKFNVKKACS
ncbi:Protein of unknown function [Flavobacterium indicum GPTSA100-9 = DSM 17447]|uniref:DUF4209 domain-containing protein n=1 Tax=Flavobacterium indicum (strain DSM 17447 / CIP 109464 / GPTSA100-9) TaxID=1094466 RepID=H8XV79_FLAIG|nr:DUF4209 domain-containing protein [Flavobacterium indicum]CCG53049.1 Protein of unknown function [Flavobacterium indicum GPTSA100-9 = DSM 17447]